MKLLVILVLSFYVSTLAVVGDQTTIVVPGNTTEVAIGLVIIPGAQIGANQYLDLGMNLGCTIQQP